MVIITKKKKREPRIVNIEQLKRVGRATPSGRLRGGKQTFQIGEKEVTQEHFEDVSKIKREEREPTAHEVSLFPEIRKEVGFKGLPREEAAVQLEAAGAFEQVTPEEISLTPEEKIGRGIPILGPSISALQSALGSIVKDTSFAGEDIRTGEEAFAIPLTPETVRESALREIRQNSFDEGISLSESIGSFIESIPVIGSLANKYASGLTQTPSANAQTALDNINKIKEAASTGQEKVRNGLEDPDYGLGRAREMEEELAQLEARIKLLISTSAQLRANADNVNKIQEEILEAKEKVNRYRTASTFGLTAQLTATGRIIPTDEQMFFELKK